MSTPKRSISVVRDYKPSSGACVRALAALLKSSVNKKTAEPTLPDGRDGTTVQGDDSADDYSIQH